MLKPQNRVIMISGANRGIGLACAEHLAELGYALSLGARSPEKIPDGPWSRHYWDATVIDSSASWAAETLETHGKLDGIVMNAGIELGGDLLSGDEAKFDDMWEVNFKGPLRLIRATYEPLKASGHGRVINIVSLAGKRILYDEILGYNASKFAALSLTHAIRKRGWEDGVRATALCPGLVETDMTEGRDPGPGRFKIAPQTIAASAAYALSLPNDAVVAELLVNSTRSL